MNRVRLSRQAYHDLESIADYLRTYDQQAAIAVLEKLEEVLRLLAENPLLGEKRDDLSVGLRIFHPSPPAAQYLVLYYPFDRGVEIAHVAHGAQNWQSLVAE